MAVTFRDSNTLPDCLHDHFGIWSAPTIVPFQTSRAKDRHAERLAVSSCQHGAEGFLADKPPEVFGKFVPRAFRNASQR